MNNVSVKGIFMVIKQRKGIVGDSGYAFQPTSQDARGGLDRSYPHQSVFSTRGVHPSGCGPIFGVNTPTHLLGSLPDIFMRGIV